MGRRSLCLVAVVLLAAACGSPASPAREAPPSPVASAPAASETLVTPTSAAPAPTTARRAAEGPTPTPAGLVLATPSPYRPARPALGDVWTRPADGMPMVFVPGGTLLMGSPEGDPAAAPDESPPHSVALDGFWLDQTEVTNAQFTAFLNRYGNRGDRGQKFLELNRGYVRIHQSQAGFETTPAAADLPVVMVTWFGAEAYCRAAGGRLPSEAEWEWAARGPAGRTFPWGEEAPDCERANFGNCHRAPVPVGSRPQGASWCGALDMAGNVWEWVGDWYGRYSTSSLTNPTGPAEGTIRVLRGGGWHSTVQQVRTTFRLSDTAPSNWNG